jgi:peptidoglycan/xylan/chitin deacetylase (PgdA/CDA1 family)
VRGFLAVEGSLQARSIVVRPFGLALVLALAAHATSCAGPMSSALLSLGHGLWPDDDAPAAPVGTVGTVDVPPSARLGAVSEDLSGPTPGPSALGLPLYNDEADPDRAGMLAEGPAGREPGRLELAGTGEVALTFDDGPSAETTAEVLRILSAHHARGTFFLTGSRLSGTGVVPEMNRGLARAIVATGHLVGNHGLDHVPLDDGRGEAFCAFQIEAAAARIGEATGADPHYFRPPYGRLGSFGRRVLARRGDEWVTWTIDAQDAVSGTDPDPARLARRLQDQLLFAGQGVVLLHDLRPGSVRALALLLAWIEVHPRFRVVDLPTYLAHAAARPLPFHTRLELLRARETMHGARAALLARSPW